MADFKYRQRSEKSVDSRASQSANDFPGIFQDDVQVYAMKKGDNAIRIVPPTWDPDHDYGFKLIEHYGIEAYVHYQVGPTKARVLCLSKMKNKSCPVCEASSRLMSSGAEDEAKEIMPRKSVICYIADMKEEEKGLQVLPMPWTLDKDIAKLTKDKETGEIYWIDDPKSGYNVYFEKDGEKLATKYNGVALAKKPSRLSTKILQQAVDTPLPEVLKWRSYKEIQELFSGGVEDDEPVRSTKRKPPVEEDEDEPAARAVKRRPRDEVDDDEIPFDKWEKEKANAKKKPPVEDEDEEPVRKPAKRKPVVEEEDEEPAPTRRRRVVEEDEEEPAPKPRRRVVEEEDEEPVRKPAKRKSVEDEDEEEPAPKPAKRRVAVVEDEDEDEPAPRKRKPPVEDEDEEENTSLRTRLANRKRG